MYVQWVQLKSDERCGFDRDKHNVGHIAKRNIRPEEVEQVLLNSPMNVTEGIHEGEERFLDIGHTEAGKVLWVWWTLRDGRKGNMTKAKPMTKKELAAEKAFAEDMYERRGEFSDKFKAVVKERKA